MADKEKSLEMRVAELEDKLAQLHVTEDEMKAYHKVSSLLGGGGGASACAPCAGGAGAGAAAAPAPCACGSVSPQAGCILDCSGGCINECAIRACTIIRSCTIRACTIIRACTFECQCWQSGGGGTFGGGGFGSLGG